MNLLKSAILITIATFPFIFIGCLKSNCTDQIKNPELFGIWYYYKVGEFYDYCDSTDNLGKSFHYDCLKLRLQKVQYQFSPERLIIGSYRDTIIDTTANKLNNTAISNYNDFRFYMWNYYFHSYGEQDWFTDNDKLLICETNSMCFESECNVYTWKIENGELFIQKDQASYVLTREDLFEKIRNSVKADTSK